MIKTKKKDGKVNISILFEIDLVCAKHNSRNFQNPGQIPWARTVHRFEYARPARYSEIRIVKKLQFFNMKNEFFKNKQGFFLKKMTEYPEKPEFILKKYSESINRA